MLANVLSFMLRAFLLLAIFAFVWRVIEPRNELMRLLRAAVLVLCLVGVLILLRVTGL